jgi:hypothetical protein
MPRFRGPLGVAVGFLIAALVAAAQEPPEPKPLPRSAAVGKDGPATTTMYLFLRTGPDEREDEIRLALGKALTASGAKYSGEPRLRSVSPTFYEELSSLVDNALPAAPVVAGDVGVRRLAAPGAVYELTVDAAQVITKLTVRYKSGEAKEYVPVAPKAGGEAEKAPPLVLIVPGRYALAVEPGQTPVEYDATLAEFGKKDEVKTAKWPVADKHFVVTLKDFVGSREAVFEKLRDARVVPVPFDVKRADDLLFAFASLNSTAETAEGDRVGTDGVYLTAENLKNSRVRRVWAYYPLDEAGMAKAVEQFRDPKFNSETLSAEIRKNAVPAGKDAPEVKADDPPRWYELTQTDGPQGPFSRRIPVENLFELASKYKTIGKLLVWEFDDGTNKPAAIRTQHPKSEVGRVYALDRFDAAWQANVKRALDRNGKK